MSDEEHNPYIEIGKLHELLSLLYEDITDEYWDSKMTGCWEDINNIKEKLKIIENWIEKHEKKQRDNNEKKE